jgi:triosephosphate isomerase
MKRKIVVGVWKDKLSIAESVRQAQELSKIFRGKVLCFDACITPSPVALLSVKKAVQGESIKVIAQDVHWPDPKRSYIGSTSISMLQEIGINICMVGHSERRRFFGETNDDVYKKLKACIEAGIYPILAIGDAEDSLTARRNFLIGQLREGLGISTDEPIDISKIAVAYEPVWAISTWRSDKPLPIGKEVSDMLALVEQILREECKMDTSRAPLLFGGSVAPENAEDYFSQGNVDGALVGGASLRVNSMARVFQIAQESWGR